MVRMAFTALSTVAILTLLAEGLAGGLLWSQGRLNSDAIREIRVILSERDSLTQEQETDDNVPVVAIEDIIKSRAVRIHHLEERETEQKILSGLMADARGKIAAEQESLLKTREQFEKEQKERQARKSSAGIEQARAILAASETELAVAQLTDLTLAETIILMEGMPEKTIAKLLAAFAAGDRIQVERGQQVFQAITRGDVAETQEGTTE